MRAGNGRSGQAKKHSRQAQAHVALAATHIDPGRYLTLMFELAYSHRQIHAMAEGTRWSKQFQAAAPIQPNAHWKFFLQRDREGERFARDAKRAAQSGMTFEEKAKWLAKLYLNEAQANDVLAALL